VLKAMEGEAGRRGGKRWGPRPLDIDILDYAGRVINWRARKPGALAPVSRRIASASTRSPAPNAGPRQLVLPHPQLHLREFVLAPLADIAPRWHHPVTGEPVAGLLRAIRDSAPRREGRVLAFWPHGLT
jgi:2-amino-4-hydroxy-6-hydroxymethyldihydropteridine diphosphokinase